MGKPGGRSRCSGRALRLAGALAGVVALATALLAAAGYAWLRSAPGERWLRAEVLARIDRRLAGRVELEALRVRGLAVVAEGIALRAPSGDVVARAERLGPVPLLGLARGRIELDGARLEGLAIEIDVVAGASPLAAALRPRAPATEADGEAGLVVRELRLERARVVVRQALVPALAPAAVAEGLSGRLLHGKDGWDLAAEGTIRAPVAGPLRVRATAPEGRLDAVAVELAAPGLDAAARLDPRAPGGPSLEVVRLAVAPEAARALWPRSPLEAPLTLAGRLARRGDAWEAEASGRLGAVHLRALAARAVPRAGGWSFSWRADAPGVRAGGGGSLRGGAIVADADVTAGDLAELGGVLGALGLRAPALRGAGRAHVAARGEGGRLSLAFDATLDGLAAGPIRARGIRLHGWAARASAPLAAARLSIAAEGVAIAGREVGGARVDARARGGQVRLDARVAGRPRLAASGRVSPGLGAVRVDALALRVAGTDWRLRGRARATVRGGTVDLRGLELRAGAQRVALSGRAGRGAVRARLVFRAVELRALSGAVPGAPRLAGRASGVLDASGALAAPRLRARGEVRGLAVAGAPRADLRLDARHEAGVTHLAARGALGGGSLALDGVVRGFPGPAPRVEATLRLDRAAARPLLAAVPGIRSASGRIDARLHVDGDATAPAVRGWLAWRDGRIATEGFGSYALALDARTDGVRAELHLAAESGRGRLTATAEGERGAGRLSFRGSAALAAFPLVTAWRLRARADGALAFAGDVSAGKLRASATLSRAAVRLPPRVGHVQGMRRPDDVKLVERDRPIASWRPPARPESAATRDEGWPRPEDPPVEIAIATAGEVPVRGEGIDVLASLAPGFVVSRAEGRWGVHGVVRLAGGSIHLLGSSVPLLAGSELQLRGPPGRPRFALAVRGGLEPPSVLVIHGEPGGLQLALPPPGAGEEEVLAALVEKRGDGEPAMASPLPLVSVRLPLAELLGAPPTSSYDAATPLGRMRLGVASQVGADARRGENARSVRLQLRLAPSLEAQASAGDAGATSADLLWSFRVRARRAPARGPIDHHVRGMGAKRGEGERTGGGEGE